MIKVRGEKPQRSVVRKLNGGFQDATLLAVVEARQQMIFAVSDRNPLENCVAIMSALQLNVATKDDVHVRQSS